MIPVRKILIILSLVSVCYCEEDSVERGHRHKYLFLTKIAYLVFLGLKIKAVLIVGSIWGIALLFGKMFALFKLLEYSKVKGSYDSDRHENIVYASSPHHESSFYDSSPALYGKSHESIASYPSEVTFNHPTSSGNAEYPPAEFGAEFGDDYAGPTYDSPVHARSNENGFYQMNTTDMAFNDMHLNTDECKKKFVCESEFNVKGSLILTTAFDLLSDETYRKYKGNYTLTDIDDCSKLFPNCYEF